MIDQSLIAANANRLGIETEAFYSFVEKELQNNGKVFGRYDRKTGEPTVPYESSSVYALLTIAYLHKGEVDQAGKIIEMMKALRSDEGSYMMTKDDAHFFDNILPMLAEAKYEKAKRNG
ncbi:hypothetical protein G4V62_16320 [Bacillaceae bacterium SIJ1]|uniref:hypothetical protein n=1 Tax=Litoribacterium kuwaitense TaxID=1398745 RepID=UPI0013ED64B1|nr:hypothetical protein [Litoribacterium kuwaitense]NGP46436.1 hypothetical protein [Litoribacterium kuwaitense]